MNINKIGIMVNVNEWNKNKSKIKWAYGLK